MASETNGLGYTVSSPSSSPDRSPPKGRGRRGSWSGSSSSSSSSQVKIEELSSPILSSPPNSPSNSPLNSRSITPQSLKTPDLSQTKQDIPLTNNPPSAPVAASSSQSWGTFLKVGYVTSHVLAFMILFILLVHLPASVPVLIGLFLLYESTLGFAIFTMNAGASSVEGSSSALPTDTSKTKQEKDEDEKGNSVDTKDQTSNVVNIMGALSLPDNKPKKDKPKNQVDVSGSQKEDGSSESPSMMSQFRDFVGGLFDKETDYEKIESEVDEDDSGITTHNSQNGEDEEYEVVEDEPGMIERVKQGLGQAKALLEELVDGISFPDPRNLFKGSKDSSLDLDEEQSLLRVSDKDEANEESSISTSLMPGPDDEVIDLQLDPNVAHGFNGEMLPSTSYDAGKLINGPLLSAPELSSSRLSTNRRRELREEEKKPDHSGDDEWVIEMDPISEIEESEANDGFSVIRLSDDEGTDDEEELLLPVHQASTKTSDQRSIGQRFIDFFSRSQVFYGRDQDVFRDNPDEDRKSKEPIDVDASLEAELARSENDSKKTAFDRLGDALFGSLITRDPYFDLEDDANF